MFGLRGNEVIGVDIGSFSVKIVQLRKTNSGWMVTAAGIVDITERRPDSSGHREADTLRAVLNCLRLIRVKTNLAVCGVGGPQVAVRNFEFPAVPDEEIERAIQLEARQVCPFNTNDIAVDYRLMPDSNGKTQGYLVVADNQLVKSMARLAKKARLDCALMDVNELALLNCFNELEKQRKKQGTAILCIGNSHTSMVIEGDNGWPFIRNLNYAGDSILKRVAAENDMTPESVKAMFFGDPREIQPEIQHSFENACSRLITDINNTVRYYGAQRRSSDIQKILICGGFALFGELVKFLDSQLQLEIKLWNPYENMRCQLARNPRGALVKGILRKNGPAMAVAAGLAMRSI